MSEPLPHPRDVFDFFGHDGAELAFEDARARGRLLRRALHLELGGELAALEQHGLAAAVGLGGFLVAGQRGDLQGAGARD